MDNTNTHNYQVVYIPGSDIDRTKWDLCVSNAVNGNICAYTWFLDIMCNGWDGLVLGNYEYIMPVPVSQRFGIRYLLQPRFIQQLGVFGSQLSDGNVMNSFLAALPPTIKVIDYNFNDKNNLPKKWNLELRPNLLLKLNKPYDELKNAYSSNLVRNLKKSIHSGLYLNKENNPEPLICLFKINKGKTYSFLKDKNYQQLTAVINASLQRNMAQVWSVYTADHELCAGVVWLNSHQKATFYFSAQSNTGRKTGALAWLIDAFIHDNASSDMILDFEGSTNPGLARFYKSFGTGIQSYPQLKINKLNPVLKVMYFIYKKIKKG